MTDAKNKKKSKFILKYLPGISLGILTISLIFFFKSQSENGSNQNGINNFVDLNFNNLKSLIIKTEFAKEDLFNFAIYRNLPLDKKNGSLLYVGNNNGEEFVELKDEIFRSNTNNYSKFKNYLKVNDKQSASLDSIIESYQDDLYESILFNDQNSIAVNSNINSIRRALFTDIALYANTIDPIRSRRFIDRQVNGVDAEKIRRITHNYREINQNEYILFAPDTILTRTFEIANKNWESEDNKSIEKWENLQVIQKTETVDPIEEIIPVRVVENRNNKRFVYPKAYLPKLRKGASSQDLDSLISSLKEVETNMRDLKFTFDIDSSNNNFRFAFSHDSSGMVGFEINTGEINDLINSAVKVSVEASVDWEKFGIKMDSLARVIEYQYADSNFNNDSLIFNLEDFEKELKRKRQEKKERNK